MTSWNDNEPRWWTWVDRALMVALPIVIVALIVHVGFPFVQIVIRDVVSGR